MRTVRDSHDIAQTANRNQDAALEMPAAYSPTTATGFRHLSPEKRPKSASLDCNSA